MPDVRFLDPQLVETHRSRTFRLQPDLRIRTLDRALRFVQERGFIYFWPIKDILLPSLWVAVAGDRPVASEHNDPGHVTWGWKDQMLDQRAWYYAKVLRGRATLISLEVAPYFYALGQNFGDPEQDYLEQYRYGLLSQPAKLIFEALLTEGPLDTVSLRRSIRMTNRASNSPFERGLVELQRDFKILPIGVAETGAWRYSFIYDLVHRYYPDLPEQARLISLSAAREKLVELYFEAVGVAGFSAVRKLFQWRVSEVDQAIKAVQATGALVGDVDLTESEEGFALARLVM